MGIARSEVVFVVLFVRCPVLYCVVIVVLFAARLVFAWTEFVFVCVGVVAVVGVVVVVIVAVSV